MKSQPSHYLNMERVEKTEVQKGNKGVFSSS